MISKTGVLERVVYRVRSAARARRGARPVLVRHGPERRGTAPAGGLRAVGGGVCLGGFPLRRGRLA